MNKVKILYIEILRIIAAFFVIYNHTGNDGFFLFSICDVGSIQFWIYMAISIFFKFAVPVFFMISGALLLARKDESLKDLYCKRIFKIVIILFAFSALNYFIELHNLKTQIVLKDFLIRLYSDKLKVYLWYLYSYISFLVSLHAVTITVVSTILDNITESVTKAHGVPSIITISHTSFKSSNNFVI